VQDFGSAAQDRVSCAPPDQPRPFREGRAAGRSWHGDLQRTFHFPSPRSCYTQPRFAQFASRRLSTRRRALVAYVNNQSRNRTRSSEQGSVADRPRSLFGI